MLRGAESALREGASGESGSGASLVLGPAEELTGWLARWAEARLEAGERLFVVQFWTGRPSRSLLSLTARFSGRIEIRFMGRDEPDLSPGSGSVDDKWAADGVALGARALEKGGWDHVVLLEVDAVVRQGFVELDRVLELVDRRPSDRGLLFLCTGAP
ncbi:MAG: hypothetical protein RBU30_19680, partial [Polyangia bacterium]|nr:hypothetical protein [Polyangia bacterium]